MNIITQLALLHLMELKRLEVDPDDGQVLSYASGIPQRLERYFQTNGSSQVRVSLGFSQKVLVYAHQLAYLSYYGVFDPATEFAFFDKDPQNCGKKNLRATIPSDGRTSKRLTSEERDAVRLMRSEHQISYANMARRYGVSRQYISKICQNLKLGK